MQWPKDYSAPYFHKPIFFNPLQKEKPNRVTSGSLTSVWRKEEALDRVGGDESLLQELCQIFINGYPKLLEKLREAVVLEDPVALQQAAHSLKGELGYLGAPEATNIAKSMEDMAREKDLSSAPASLVALEQSLALLHLAIDKSTGVQ